MKNFCFVFALTFILKLANAQSPTITSVFPDSGSVGTLVTITGTALSDPTVFTIGGISAIVISSSDSTLVGMVMPGSVTGAVAVATSIGNASTDSSFTVLSTPFPNTQQGDMLVDTVDTGDAYQGGAVAVSADGNTAIVGGHGNLTTPGGAWIYTRSGSTWSQQGPKLVGTGLIGVGHFGYSVALSADGNTAIVGVKTDNQNIGAIVVFVRSGNSWSQQGGKLVGSGVEGPVASQGCSVGLSADGNTAIVGGCSDNGGLGAVWIFTRNGGIWSQQGSKLVGTGVSANFYTGGGQGGAVAISADGTTAMVGGYGDHNSVGAAWIYVRNGNIWSQEGSKLVGIGALGASRQGYSVALSADGNTAISGAYGDDNENGAAWVFVRNGNTWSQQGDKLLGSGLTGTSHKGESVAISADGNTAMVGGPNANSFQGAAWVFTRNGDVWTQAGSWLDGTGATGISSQGKSVALSADGTTALLGGPHTDSGMGAVWAFIYVPPAVNAISSPIESVSSSVVPNPSNGKFSISPFGDVQGTATVQLFDSAGRVILQQVWQARENAFVLDTQLDNGMYLLMVTADDGHRYNGRVVIAN